MMMQPSWRNQGGQLVRDVPQGEIWQTLKKGGMSGIYVVKTGLSWLIAAEKSEHAEHPDTLSLVKDISWVIQQMKKGMTTKQVAKKRACHGDAEIFTRKT